ncbi:MAG: hypothetical protein GY950_22335, partial [bacterium]|nr:hypothetical protein [bacterium]
MKKIFIAERADEPVGFWDQCNRNNIDISEFSIIALEPSVKTACKEKGISYIDTLPFFNTESHKRVLTKSHQLTTLVLEELSFDVKTSVNRVLVDSFIFYSRFYINNFL